MSFSETNGTTRKLLWWLLGIFATAILVAGGASAKTIIDNAQRITAIERDNAHVCESLRRIETKLDRIMEDRK